MDIVGYSKLSVNVMWIVPDWFVRLLWAHLRLRRGIAFEPVVQILMSPSRRWKWILDTQYVPRPPRLNFEDAEPEPSPWPMMFGSNY